MESFLDFDASSAETKLVILNLLVLEELNLNFQQMLSNCWNEHVTE